MSLAAAFAVHHARKYGIMVFFRETIEFPGQQTYGLDDFEGWQFVSMPDGRVLDAIPVPTTHNTLSGAARIMEAYA